MGKRIHFLGSSLKELQQFPEDVRHEVGFSLRMAQDGGKAINVVPLVGFAGASVLEVIANHDGDTYRTVYTVQLAEAIYVLHSFQKKSNRGRQTPKKDVDLVKRRLKDARTHHSTHYEKGQEKTNA